VRPTSHTTMLVAHGVQLRTGDLSDGESLRRALDGVETLVNIASLGFGHAPAIVQAAQTAGVRRAVFLSTTAIFTHLSTPTVSIRARAEDLIRGSRLNYTIVRPTMIYGTPRDRNIWRLIRYLRRVSIIPVFGDGTRLQQPVYVGDVADAIYRILLTPATIGREYNLAGAAAITFNELIDTVARALQRSAIKIHLPMRLGVWLAAMGQRMRFGPRISREQILRLAEDKAYDLRLPCSEFGYDPVTFAEGLRREVAILLGA